MTEFKVGDWVRHEDGRTGRILEIDKNGFDVFCVFPSSVGRYYSGYGCCLPKNLTKLYPKFDNLKEFFIDFLPLREEKVKEPKVKEPKFEVGETVFVVDPYDRESGPHQDIIKKIHPTTEGYLYIVQEFNEIIYREEDLVGLVKEAPDKSPRKFCVGDQVIFYGSSGRTIGLIDEVEDGHYSIINTKYPCNPFRANRHQLFKLNDINMFWNGDKVMVTERPFLEKGKIFTISRSFDELTTFKLIDENHIIYYMGTDTSGLQLILDP